jgi:hypothetical protein
VNLLFFTDTAPLARVSQNRKTRIHAGGEKREDVNGASAVSDYLVGPGFPWQLRRLLPDIFTLLNVQNSRAPVAVFTRQIDEVPGDDKPLPTWIW